MATFSEKDEDANWKRKYEEAERDLQDFQESSRLIEKELEMSLDQAEQQIRELRSKCNRLQFENETLRVSFTEQSCKLV